MIRSFALILALFTALPAPAAEVHFAPRENLEALDIATLASARQSIDMAAYVLTDLPVIGALRAAAMRGVAVRIVRDAGQMQAGGARIAAAAMRSTWLAKSICATCWRRMQGGRHERFSMFLRL